MPDEFEPSSQPQDEPLLTSTEDAPLNDDLYSDELTPEEENATETPATEPTAVVATPVAAAPVAESTPEPEALPAFDYKPQLPTDIFTADEHRYIEQCEDSTDPKVRIQGRQFETNRIQQYNAQSEGMARSHMDAIPASVMQAYGPAARDYMSRVPAARRNDPELSVEVVMACAYDHARQLGGGQANLAKVIRYLDDLYNGQQTFAVPTAQVPPPPRASAPPPPIPASQGQPRSSVGGNAPTATASRSTLYDAAVKKLVDEMGMEPSEARRAVSASKEAGSWRA